MIIARQVQKRLQMRIEVQGKYMQAILDKAQKSLSIDMKNNSNNVEATRAELTNFNLALSNLMQDMNETDRKGNILRANGGGDPADSNKEVKVKIEGGGSVHLDLNTMGSYQWNWIGKHSVLSYDREKILDHVDV